jgi:hypothetical protein
MASSNQNHDFSEGPRKMPRSPARLETCLEFSNADLACFVRHLNEGFCEKCLKLLPAVKQVAEREGISLQRRNEAPAGDGESSAAMRNSVNHWLFREYSLIPPRERPMIGSNDWFRWLEDFERRHPVEVSQLREPLPTRACRVLWNSR